MVSETELMGATAKKTKKISVPLAEGVIGGGMVALILGGILLPGLGVVLEGAIAVLGAGIGAATALAMRRDAR